MSASELLLRGLRWSTQQVERRRIRSGRVPLPVHPVGLRRSLFPAVPGWQSAWAAHYRLDPEGLDRLLQGRIDLFGHPPLDVGIPVDWHREPASGLRLPLDYGKGLNYRDEAQVGNIKFIWELGRHQHLIPLAAAYVCSGDVRYRQAVVAQIEGWIHDNPYGRGVHWCSALEVSLRLIAWTMVHSLLALRDGEQGLFATVSSRQSLGCAIYQQAKFVRGYLSCYSSANNHLIGELTGLWVASQAFDLGPEGERWATTAQVELEREARLQVFADGVNKEQAFYYHLWVLEYLLMAWLVGERSGKSFSAGFRDRILAMAEFLRSIMPPGGHPPSIGDSDDGFVTRFEATWPRDPYGDVVTAVGHVFAVAGLASVRPRLPEKAFWYGLLAGRRADSETRVAPAGAPSYPQVYREGGYAILGGNTVRVVFDAGSLGYPAIAAHGHADALSFCLAVDGEWWLVDPGTYAYHSEHLWRDYFRGTAAHNTLQVDGRDQSTSGGPFLWLRHARAQIEGSGVDGAGCQWVGGHHDGYALLGVIHHRQLRFDPKQEVLVVSDWVEGTGRHEYAVHFHLAPRLHLTPGQDPHSWVVSHPQSPRRLMLELDPSWHWEALRGSLEPVLGWYSPALGHKVPSSTLRGRKQGDAPERLVTRLHLGACRTESGAAGYETAMAARS
jgi:hypothetical protein